MSVFSIMLPYEQKAVMSHCPTNDVSSLVTVCGLPRVHAHTVMSWSY